MVGAWPDGLDAEVLEQLAGVAGVGWTASLLAYVGLASGFGADVVGRVVADPEPLLYLGAACFLATVGLDRLANARADG